jgi:adenylate cyclase
LDAVFDVDTFGKACCDWGFDHVERATVLLFTLGNERQKKQFQHREGPLEFGRLQQGQCARILVEDPYTSRDQLRIEELPGGDIRLQNLGGPVTLPDGSQLNVGGARKFTPPLRVVFGRSTLDIGVIPNEDHDKIGSSLQTISKPVASDSRNLKPPSKLGRVPSAEMLGQWFETLLTVQRAAAGSSAFYAETARAVVELVGLDRGLVIIRRNEVWEVAANHSAAGSDNRQFSMRVLMQVQRERRTFFQTFDDASVGQSLMGLEALVASPIFDEHDAVAGIVYGSRDMRSMTGQQRGIEALEAQFVQLLAGAVSAGLTRMAREADAARARVQFEQFFSPELARALEMDSGILAANERELTLLFADLRGFSKISERIGAGETYLLLADILDRLTNQIMDHSGVVIDYYGDGLAAMWNAPANVPQHAERAALAAIAMLAELPAINSQWAERLGGIVRLGVGIHTGRAQVGNSGSRRRLKYGPRGHAVNLTSRVEAATKVFGVACLLTAATRQALTGTYDLRRVCRGRLTGMVEPVDLYELPADGNDPSWAKLRAPYEAALAHYESDRAGECRAACLAILSGEGGSDGPTKWLLARAERRIAESDRPFEAVFAVETK